MTYSEGHLTGRIGYGYQSQPSELAAVLALSEVAPDYPARFGRVVRTVADIIDYEKLTCRPGTDMSMKLVALSHYVREPSWKDNLGNEWTLQRIVTEELNRPTGNTPHAATNRLLGLVSAVNRFKADKTALEGDLARAETYIDEAMRYAFSSQNSDGSWGRASTATFPPPFLIGPHAGMARLCHAGQQPGRSADRGRHRLPDHGLQLAALPDLHLHDECSGDISGDALGLRAELLRPGGLRTCRPAAGRGLDRPRPKCRHRKRPSARRSRGEGCVALTQDCKWHRSFSQYNRRWAKFH